MATVSFSTAYASTVTRQVVRPTARRIGRPNAGWSWQAVADTASGLTFLGVLAWAVWHIGSVLVQLVPQVAAAGGGYLF